MKRVLTAVWGFLEAWGEYKYQVAKRNNFRY